MPFYGRLQKQSLQNSKILFNEKECSMEQNVILFIVACLMILVLGLQMQIRSLRSMIKKMDEFVDRKNS